VTPLMAPLSYSLVDTQTLWIRLFSAIAERKWLILALWVCAVAVAAAYCILTPPSYRSTAVVRIEPEAPYAQAVSEMFKSLQGLAGEDNDAEDGTDLHASTRSHIAKKRSLQSETTGGQTAPYPSNKDASSSRKPSAKLVVGLSPARTNATDGSELVQLEATAGDPAAAHRMLTSFLEEYRREHVSEAGAQIDRLKGRFEKELADFDRQADASRRELIAFTVEHGMVLDGERASHDALLFRQAINGLVQSRRDRWDLETRVMSAGDNITRRGRDESTRQLRSNLKAIQADYDLPKEEGSGLSRVVLKRKIESMRQDLRDRDSTPLDLALLEARTKEKAAEQTYAQLKRDALKTNSVGLRLEILKQSAEADERLLLEVRRKLKELELYRGLRRDSIVVESPPSLPSKPAYPQTTKVMLAAAFLGLVLGLGTVVAVSLLDKRVKTTEEIRGGLGVPVLGEVPKVEPIREPFAAGAAGSLAEMIPYWVPVSPFSDALRIVNNSVFHALETDRAALVFSSALPGEGKTFVALGFAAAAASDSKRVIVIDADLRRSRIRDAFQVPVNTPGLTELLATDSHQLDETIRETNVPGLHYVPAGRPTDNPVAVLKNPGLVDLLAQLRVMYDVVVIDCPPLIGLADSVIVAAHADGVVLVVRQGYATMDAVNAARTSLESARVKLIGSVVNMADRGAGHYRGNRYFASYYQSNRRRRPAA